MESISHDELVRTLNYCCKTGEFTWKKREGKNIFNSIHAGKIAGSVFKHHSGNEYLVIRINRKLYYAHRLAYFYFYGETPDQIDHIDGCGLNNCIANIRDSSYSINAKNKKKPKTNTSGCIGVGFCRRTGKWYAQIRHDKKQYNLGRFPTMLEAASARFSKQNKLEFHKNHGRVK